MMVDDECYLPQKSWFNRFTQGSPEFNKKYEDLYLHSIDMIFDL